jgi:hypothetical protein
MVRVLLIAAVAACGGASPPQATAPLVTDQPAVPDALWDQGTFIVVDKEKIEPNTEERFEIFRTSTGYRFAVTWKRPAPTGEPAEGSIDLETDAQFSPVSGGDVMTLHAPAGKEVTRSTIRRDPDGRIATELVAADGTRTSNKSASRNDWFIGGMFTAFLTVICQADPELTSPLVYPDKTTELGPAKPMAIEGTDRAVTYRILTYTASKNRVVAACEDGKLAGEVTRGVTIVRTGDLALARELEKRFR